MDDTFKKDNEDTLNKLFLIILLLEKKKLDSQKKDPELIHYQKRSLNLIHLS
jgi:hypothetical protein